jgi:hypothetical protein
VKPGELLLKSLGHTPEHAGHATHVSRGVDMRRLLCANRGMNCLIAIRTEIRRRLGAKVRARRTAAGLNLKHAAHRVLPG